MKEKRSLIPRGCTVPSLEMRRISCLLRLSLPTLRLPEMGQRTRIFMSEIQWLPELKCLATGWLASLAETARRCSPNLVLNNVFQFLQYKAGYTVNEMGGSAREIVLDIVSEFGCQNDSGGIYKLTSVTLGYSTYKFYAGLLSCGDIWPDISILVVIAFQTWKFEPSPISGGNGSRKRQEVRLISKRVLSPTPHTIIPDERSLLETSNMFVSLR